MELFRSLSGTVRARVTSADIPAAVSAIRTAGVEMQDLQTQDPLTVSFTIPRSKCKTLRSIMDHRGNKVELLEKHGIYWTLLQLKKRPVLVSGLTILLLISLLMPGRILFVQVQGNSTVPTRMILEKAAQFGVNLGASARSLRSEHIKNAVLSEIEQLQWLGVNTYGCVAVISVRERHNAPQEQAQPPITSIVADRDGIIQSLTVSQGTALCKPGDSVTAGQTLISGFADLGICITGTRAQGEIVALTQRDITVVTPAFYDRRGEISDSSPKFSLLIGKKRINFYKGSGILDASCARIYSEWYVTLPGGFVLPFGLVKETYITYNGKEQVPTEFDLSAFSRHYLLEHMTAGEILTSAESLDECDGLITLRGRYGCREMLGIIRIEENFENYGKDPGADR